ncbi:TPA: hypothetical protein ACPZJO_000442 [Yersinia enterocolitica]|nr:Uncharacterised protein [Yersinia enterocolitica]HDL7460911.1 hypothetical protein [Yersinia enterocolitica]
MRSKVTDVAEMRIANTAATSSPKNIPKSLVLQQGDKSTHPDELTLVSDSGKWT